MLQGEGSIGGEDRLEALSLPDLIYRHLRDDILAGRVESGAPLRQEEIALRFGVSRLPVREALRQLEAEGLAVLRPRRGYIATSLTEADIDDIFEIQAMLEERAGYFAALNRTAVDIDEVEAALAAVNAILDADTFDLGSYGNAVTAFHMRFIAAAHRPYLVRYAQKSRALLERYVLFAAEDRNESRIEHAAIVAAFRAGDVATTAKLSRQHMETTRNRLVDILSQKHAARSKP